jgi:heme/copper-type cytochrome/quinol oxidase subunit 2
MTVNQRVGALTALAIPLLAGWPGPGDARADDFDTVQVVSTNVQGKNVYIPSTIVLTSGKSYKLSLFNTTDVPHGFSIAGLGVENILPPQQEYVIELPPLEEGKLHRIHCHLHPAHRGGTLVVLDAD